MPMVPGTRRPALKAISIKKVLRIKEERKNTSLRQSSRIVKKKKKSHCTWCLFAKNKKINLNLWNGITYTSPTPSVPSILRGNSPFACQEHISYPCCPGVPRGQWAESGLGHCAFHLCLRLGGILQGCTFTSRDVRTNICVQDETNMDKGNPKAICGNAYVVFIQFTSICNKLALCSETTGYYFAMEYTNTNHVFCTSSITYEAQSNKQTVYGTIPLIATPYLYANKM